MPQFEIESYEASVLNRPGENWERISLRPANSYDGPIWTVTLWFRYDRNDPGVGYRGNGYVFGFDSRDRFEVVHRLLQTEEPTFFRWSPDRVGFLDSYDVTTEAEPPGEGPAE
ncbi:hypothetical protein ACFO0N_12850 [Halobium salinum]|uniref:Uncharacterized protein n=1 Tax=Halobium salinum TaxID=1364940 RepID=A0ABD5PDJ5_9EURY|nr:hypothetical protein [Halobium salinum]